jgi:hypothetical protein
MIAILRSVVLPPYPPLHSHLHGGARSKDTAFDQPTTPCHDSNDLREV